MKSLSPQWRVAANIANVVRASPLHTSGNYISPQRSALGLRSTASSDYPANLPLHQSAAASNTYTYGKPAADER